MHSIRVESTYARSQIEIVITFCFEEKPVAGRAKCFRKFSRRHFLFPIFRTNVIDDQFHLKASLNNSTKKGAGGGFFSVVQKIKEFPDSFKQQIEPGKKTRKIFSSVSDLIFHSNKGCVIKRDNFVWYYCIAELWRKKIYQYHQKRYTLYKIQGDPNQNPLFQMAVPLKLCISDPMLVKPI